LQTIHHPYLYLRSLRENIIINTVIKQIEEDQEPELPLKIEIHKDYAETLIMNANLIRLDLSKLPTITMVEKKILTPGPRDISEIDLLEGDVSIFEFKVLTGEYSDGLAYAEWLRHGQHYTKVFKLLSRVLSPKTAYHALPALVHAAYKTTYPVSAFALLLGYMLESPERFSSFTHAKHYYVEILETLMMFGDLNIVEPVGYKNKMAVDDKFEFVGGLSMEYYLKEEKFHPLRPMATELWSSYKRGILSDDWLFDPYEYIKKYGHCVRNDIINLQPPMMAVIYDSADISPDSYFYLVSPLYSKKLVPGSKKVGRNLEYGEYIHHLLARKQIIWALISNMFTRSPHLCIHEDCPYYSTDLCKKFYSIPDKYKDCRFPEWLRTYTKRKLNPVTNMLVKA
jgi:hypothetical protein